MFWLWLIVTVLFFAVGVYVLGTLDWNDPDKIGLFWTIFFGSLMWPVVLAAVAVFGPFLGLFWLGERKRKQKENSTTNK